MRHWLFLPACAMAAAFAVVPAAAQPADPPASLERDGQHDFDWEIGTWTTHVRVLRNPLTDSATWVEFEGTSVVREIMGGRANLVELSVEGPAGRIEGISLRLYDPGSRRWSLNFASLASGEMSPPVIGGFQDERGLFYGRETIGGREVLVRFVISDITADSARFEQAFSADGGVTWEVNWIATDRRR